MSAHTSQQIDGYRVQFDAVEGWTCRCGGFERSNICPHTQLAALTRAIECSFEPVHGTIPVSNSTRWL